MPLNTLSHDSKNILSILQKKGPQTKNDLLHETNLKLTSLNRLLGPLFDLSFIENTGIYSSTGGRPSSYIDINTKKYASVGIDISRTSTTIVLTTLNMKLIESDYLSLTPDINPEDIQYYIIKKISSYQKKYPDKVILGIGIGMIGPLNKETGEFIDLPPTPVQRWFRLSLKKPIESALNLPVMINSGSNLAILSEHLFGEASAFKNVAYINCGVGIRSSLVFNGELIEAPFAREDLFAHTIIDYTGAMCRCGQQGCIEATSCLHSMLKIYNDNTTSSFHASQKINSCVSYTDFFQEASHPNSVANEILYHGARILGLGISNYAKLFNLEYIILSGPLVQNTPIFYNRVITTAIEQLKTTQNDFVLFNQGGTFKHNSIAIGGSCYIVETFLNKEPQ